MSVRHPAAVIVLLAGAGAHASAEDARPRFERGRDDGRQDLNGIAPT